MRFRIIFVTFLSVAATLVVVPAIQARDKKTKPAKDPQDAIEVVGHVASTNGPVTRFLVTQHYRRYYLYAEHGSNVSMIDVTNSGNPLVLADVSYPSNGGTDNLVAVAGTAALISESQSASVAVQAAPETFRIMDFSDPQHPSVAREFTGVTAMTRDDRRGLIFVANREGIWILRQTFALDPEVEKEYARHVLYDH